MKQCLLIILILLYALQNYAQTEFWGLTSKGGSYGAGTIFKTDGQGTNLATQHSFYKNIGSYPENTKLIQASDGKLYGATPSVLFSLDPLTNVYKTIYVFPDYVGSNIYGSLVQASDGNLYGMTSEGGNNNDGTIFRFNISTQVFTKIYDLDDNSNPHGSLVQATNGLLYGMTTYGGVHGLGTLFQFNLSDSTFTKLLDFDGINYGANPFGDLMQASDGYIYGLTSQGGANGDGVIFQLSITTNTFSKKYDFNSSIGSGNPVGQMVEANNGFLYGTTAGGGGGFLLGAMFKLNLSNYDFAEYNLFGGSNGYYPMGSPMLASDGYLYGLTNGGGQVGPGTIYKFNTFDSSCAAVHDFSGESDMLGTLMQASNGKLYGMTKFGGNCQSGIIFEFNISTNSYVKKIDFNCSENGEQPTGSLIKASNDKLYGLTSRGGLHNRGVLFQYDPINATLIKKFDFGDSIKEAWPYGSLIEMNDGKLYGLSYAGTIFSFDLNTEIFKNESLLSENGGDFHNPYGSLIKISDSVLVGMTTRSNWLYSGAIFKFNIITKIYTDIFNFDGNTGSVPYGDLLLANNGMLYGMAAGGGAFQKGVLFKFDPSNYNYTILSSFDEINTGSYPTGSLVQASNGMIYGATTESGPEFGGVLFQLDPNTNIVTAKINLSNYFGNSINGRLIEASDAMLYGLTELGGYVNGYNSGVLFQYNTLTNTYTIQSNFTDLNGAQPKYTSLLETSPLIGIKETKIPKEEDAIQVYPNPSEGSFNIVLKNNIEELKVEIFSVLGERILLNEFKMRGNTQFEFNHDLSQGTYLLKISSGNLVRETIRLVVTR